MYSTGIINNGRTTNDFVQNWEIGMSTNCKGQKLEKELKVYIFSQTGKGTNFLKSCQNWNND